MPNPIQVDPHWPARPVQTKFAGFSNLHEGKEVNIQQDVMVKPR
jgi:hypothetical protein